MMVAQAMLGGEPLLVEWGDGNSMPRLVDKDMRRLFTAAAQSVKDITGGYDGFLPFGMLHLSGSIKVIESILEHRDIKKIVSTVSMRKMLISVPWASYCTPFRSDNVYVYSVYYFVELCATRGLDMKVMEREIPLVGSLQARQ